RKVIVVTRKFARTINLEDSVVDHEPRFLFENLVISPASTKGPKYSFIFPRSDAALVEQIVQKLRERLSEPAFQEQEQGAAVSSPPRGARGSARVSRVGARVLAITTSFRVSRYSGLQHLGKKIVSARRRNQHTRRVRYPNVRVTFP